MVWGTKYIFTGGRFLFLLYVSNNFSGHKNLFGGTAPERATPWLRACTGDLVGTVTLSNFSHLSHFFGFSFAEDTTENEQIEFQKLCSSTSMNIQSLETKVRGKGLQPSTSPEIVPVINYELFTRTELLYKVCALDSRSQVSVLLSVPGWDESPRTSFFAGCFPLWKLIYDVVWHRQRHTDETFRRGYQCIPASGTSVG